MVSRQIRDEYRLYIFGFLPDPLSTGKFLLHMFLILFQHRVYGTFTTSVRPQVLKTARNACPSAGKQNPISSHQKVEQKQPIAATQKLVRYFSFRRAIECKLCWEEKPLCRTEPKSAEVRPSSGNGSATRWVMRLPPFRK